MAILTKQVVLLSLVLIPLASPAQAQQSGGTFSQVQVAREAPKPKLVVSTVNLYNLKENGVYETGNINLTLDRGPNNPTANFGLQVKNVRTLQEAYDQLKPAVVDLANELKAASEDFNPPH